MSQPNPEQQLYSMAQTAAVLGVSERKIRYMIQSREIESVRLGNRIVRISKKTIDKLIENGTVPKKKQLRN
jgi:excisionase family DNA binding protein